MTFRALFLSQSFSFEFFLPIIFGTRPNILILNFDFGRISWPDPTFNANIVCLNNRSNCVALVNAFEDFRSISPLQEPQTSNKHDFSSSHGFFGRCVIITVVMVAVMGKFSVLVVVITFFQEAGVENTRSVLNFVLFIVFNII